MMPPAETYKIVDTPKKWSRCYAQLLERPIFALDTETVGKKTSPLLKKAAGIEKSINYLEDTLTLLRTVRNCQYRKSMEGVFPNWRQSKARIRDYIAVIEGKVKRAKALQKEVSKELTYYRSKFKEGLFHKFNILGCIQLDEFLIRPDVVDRNQLEELLIKADKVLIHHAAFDLTQLAEHLNITWDYENVWCTHIAESLITNGRIMDRSGLAPTLERRFGVFLNKDKVIRLGDWAGTWTPEMLKYATEDTAWLNDLYLAQKDDIERGKLEQALRLELDLLPVVVEMHTQGMGVNIHQVDNLIAHYAKVVEENERTFLDMTQGMVTKANSPKQILEWLQVGLKLDVKDANKKTINKHKDLPAIQALLEYRKNSKLLGTYLKPFKEKSLPFVSDDPRLMVEYRIYGSFKQVGTETGRFSSADPNLQNLPKTEEFRSLIVPRTGYKLVIADLASIEMRIFAEFAGETRLIGAFQDGHDPHIFCAAMMLNKEEEDITPEERQNLGKTLNYALQFQQTPYGMSRTTGFSEQKCAMLQKRYFVNFRRMKGFSEELIQLATQNGYARTATGRKRWLPGINGRGKEKGHAQRAAVNSVIQGTAAEIMKEWLVETHWLLKRLDGKARIIATVHDEIILEVLDDPEVTKNAASLLLDALETTQNKYMEHIPLEASPVVCNSWSEAK